MNDRYYSTCARCGDQAGRFAHVMAATGRTLCGRCWRDLKFDSSGRKVDDLVTPDDRSCGYPVDKSGTQDV